MGLQSALTTALTGLQAAETTIDVVGNNIANSQTVGFKESEAAFATQFLQTISIGSAPSTNSGGTNPRQIGLGVKVSEITPNFTQGTIEISSNPLDLAIQGDGFLIVQSGTNQFYTRNGQLKLNALNEVVTPTGQRLLGYGVNDDFEIITDNLIPLSIPLGKERVAQATRTVNFSGVLNPSVDLGATPSISESVVLGDGTVEVPTSTAGFDINDINEVIEIPDTSGVAETITGAGSVPTDPTLNYRFAFEDGNGEVGALSPIYTVDNLAGSGEVAFDPLPTITGIVWTGDIVIYRENQTDNLYYEVGREPSGTTTHSDILADSTLLPRMDADIIDAGSYSYYVTYFDPSTGTETRPTARIGTTTLASPGGKIRLDFSPLDPPIDPAFTQIRVYRNLSSESSAFHRVDSDSNPIVIGVTDSFVDNQPSSTIALNTALDVDGPVVLADTRLVDLIVRNGESYISNFFEAGTLSFQAEKDGVELAAKTLTIVGDPLVPSSSDTTLLELVNFMRDVMGIDTTSDVPATPFPPPAANVEIINGQIRITSNLGEENAIEVSLTAFRLTPTGATTVQTLPISFSEIQAADGPGTSTEMIVYDSLGLPLKVRITTTLEDKTSNSTVYRWYATSADNEPFNSLTTVVGDGLLEFDSNGDLTSATQSRISIQRNITASESPLEVDLNFTEIKALGETDAQGNPISSLSVTSQDGFPPGVLTSFIITNDGVIQGQFSNGTQRVVGQVVMARFSNNSGLTQVGDSLFDIGVNSGDPILGTPGELGIGSLTAGAVELSNTDIGQNLIQLILASTQYRGGARVITATQELLDELLALQR